MRIVVLFLVVILLYVAYAGVRIWVARSVGHEAVARAVPYQRTEGTKHVLVVGDSTAVGVGASKPEASVAGLIAVEFPNVSIENHAVSGAKLADVIAQLEVTTGTYDLVLVNAGANDVLFLSSEATMQEGVKDLFIAAHARSENVVVLTAGNIGLAPVLPWPLGYFMTARTKAMRSLMMQEASASGAHYVDLFKERGADPFENDIESYYAPDRLHLSDNGYAHWYSEIRRQAAAAFKGL